jgi:hypothetical protein
VKTPTRQGFGGKVINAMIEQLKGTTRFDWRPEGLVCEITLQARKSTLTSTALTRIDLHHHNDLTHHTSPYGGA